MKRLRINGCSRCGHDHEGVRFDKLTRPMTVEPVTFTHWATCPTNGEPILIQVDE